MGELKQRIFKDMRTYLQPNTIITEWTTTAALLSVSPAPTTDLNLGIGGAGDPINGR